jgi:hypothetical protein
MGTLTDKTGAVFPLSLFKASKKQPKDSKKLKDGCLCRRQGSGFFKAVHHEVGDCAG